ncbi:hypothetical protein PF005_g6244 [Phytophthora fragariae]|uniref:Uncharacterized protein n=1 Tax=Phytophthora fragariae TaxID=53985 RepID=A0A6A3YU84_9STRA|nr:hypothetical protein PF005_g6244 [Phytophthora fragariae]
MARQPNPPTTVSQEDVLRGYVVRLECPYELTGRDWDGPIYAELIEPRHLNPGHRSPFVEDDSVRCPGWLCHLVYHRFEHGAVREHRGDDQDPDDRTVIPFGRLTRPFEDLKDEWRDRPLLMLFRFVCFKTCFLAAADDRDDRGSTAFVEIPLDVYLVGQVVAYRPCSRLTLTTQSVEARVRGVAMHARIATGGAAVAIATVVALAVRAERGLATPASGFNGPRLRPLVGMRIRPAMTAGTDKVPVRRPSQLGLGVSIWIGSQDIPLGSTYSGTRLSRTDTRSGRHADYEDTHHRARDQDDFGQHTLQQTIEALTSGATSFRLPAAELAVHQIAHVRPRPQGKEILGELRRYWQLPILDRVSAIQHHETLRNRYRVTEVTAKMIFAVNFGTRPLDHFLPPPAQSGGRRSVTHDSATWGSGDTVPVAHIISISDLRRALSRIYEAAVEWYPRPVAEVFSIVHANATKDTSDNAPRDLVYATINLYTLVFTRLFQSIQDDNHASVLADEA